MSRRSVTTGLVIVVVGLALWPDAAGAQSAIAGQVRDNTGGVLPGVTVEAASPALIEGSRTVVTDGQGRYSIVNLEPGVYTVTFSLPGFSTLAREGIQLPADFTATVNATLTVGALEETVTVSGESPIVDVQQVQRTQVLSREVLDVIPTGRNTWTQAGMLAGVRMTGADVGGSRYVSDLLLESHGASALHSVYTVDGMMVNTMINDGRDQNYYQDQSNQEISVQTSGGNAEVSSGGVRLNMVPKDGGNTFAGTAYAGGSAGSWQSDNLSKELKAKGLQAVDKIDRIFDYNATLGGPILRDRLWFYQSWRLWGVWDPPADTFRDDGSQFRPERQIWSPVIRLTYQATPRNKINLHFDRQAKRSGPELTATYPPVINSRGTDPETANLWQDPQTPYGVAQAKWTSTLSTRLLLEAGHSMSRTYVLLKPNKGVAAPVGSPEWFSRVQKQDLDRGTIWNAAGGFRWRPIRHTFSTSLAYVTGSHNVKVGFQNSWGKYEQFWGWDTNGHILRQQYRSGLPTAAIVTNYPTYLNPKMNYDLGIYAQDSWTRDRLTLNGGVRFEWLNSEVAEQNAPAGRFVPARHFPATKNVPDWFDVRPRFGLAYDLFGDAKTALKFSIGSYSTPHGTSFAERFNPMNRTDTFTLPWSDRDLQGRSLPTNGDDIVQDNELDLTRIPTNFGVRSLDRFDPDIEREYNVETGLSMQHELLPNVSVSAGWYRRAFYNLYSEDNVLRDASDYRPVEVVSPHNGEVFTVYDIKSPTELARVDKLVTNAREGRAEVYNGFEFAIEARLPAGGTVLASSTTQRTIRETCDEGSDDPNKLRFCDRGNLPAPYKGVPFRRDFKIAGSYPLPWDVQVSASLRSEPGRDTDDLTRVDELLPIDWLITRSTRYTAEGCAGRPCTPGALVVPNMVLASLTIPLAPAGTERFLPRQNQLDLGVRKMFRTRGISYEAAFEVFNALNASTILRERSANFGTAAFAVPSQVLFGRLPRLSLLVKW